METMKKLRTLKDGKLKIGSDGLLPVNADGTILSGDVRNIWAGLATLHALFVQEHNAVCDALKVLVQLISSISKYICTYIGRK